MYKLEPFVEILGDSNFLRITAKYPVSFFRMRGITGEMNNLLINQNSYRFLVIAIIYVPVLAVFAFTILVSTYADVPIDIFLRDATATLDGHPLTGMQSNIGVLVWCAAAAICFFSSAVLQRTSVERTLPSFFFWSGVITSVLLLDDLFVFHDNLAIWYLGLNEKVVLVGYGLAVASYLAKFHRTILSNDYSLLFIAGVFFSSSIGIDLFLEKWESPIRIFLEDGFKLLGIVSWSGYFILNCFHTLQLLPFGFSETSSSTGEKIKVLATEFK